MTVPRKGALARIGAVPARRGQGGQQQQGDGRLRHRSAAFGVRRLVAAFVFNRAKSSGNPMVPILYSGLKSIAATSIS